MPAASPISDPTLPDGSSPPDGVGRQLLALFDHMSPGERKPLGRSRLRSYLMQTKGGPVSEPELEQILVDLNQRGLIVDAPHPGPSFKGPQLPEFPGMPKLPDAYLPGDPQPGEACFATTELGAKAAHLCRTLLRQRVAAWRLGSDRVHDQVLTALQPSFPTEFAAIDAVCCCTPTDEVRRAIDRACSWGLLRSDAEDAYKLTPDGEGRMQQVLIELLVFLQDSGKQKAVSHPMMEETMPAAPISRRTALALGDLLNDAFSLQVPDPEDPIELTTQIQGDVLYDFLIERDYDETFCNSMRQLQGPRAVKDAIIQIHTGSFWTESQNGQDSERGQQVLLRLVGHTLRDLKEARRRYRTQYVEPLFRALKDDGFQFEDGELVPLATSVESANVVRQQSDRGGKMMGLSELKQEILEVIARHFDGIEGNTSARRVLAALDHHGADNVRTALDSLSGEYLTRINRPPHDEYRLSPGGVLITRHKERAVSAANLVLAYYARRFRDDNDVSHVRWTELKAAKPEVTKLPTPFFHQIMQIFELGFVEGSVDDPDSWHWKVPDDIYELSKDDDIMDTILRREFKRRSEQTGRPHQATASLRVADGASGLSEDATKILHWLRGQVYRTWLPQPPCLELLTKQ
jgi:hypothetical protein